MDKKNILVIVGLVGFLLIWQTLILPSLPKDMMEEPIQVVSSANLAHPAPSQGNLSVPPKEPQFPSSSVEVKDSLTAPKTNQTPPEVSVSMPALPEVVTTIETEVFIARFTSKGGVLTELAIKDIHPAVGSEEAMVLMSRPGLVRSGGSIDMKVEETRGDKGPILTYWNAQERVIYRFEEGSHFFTVEHEALKSGQALKLTLSAVEKDPSASQGQFARGNDGAVYSLKQQDYGDNSAATLLTDLGPAGLVADSPSGDLTFAGFRSPYFGLFIEPSEGNANSHRVVFESQPEGAKMTILASEAPSSIYKVYAGPISRELLYEVDQDRYGTLFNYTGINVIIHFLLWLLDFYHAIPGINMGIAILMLTLTVKVVLFPMNLKAQTSMFMMSKIGPQIKEMQEKFKNDRQQLGVKQMELFRENGVNPLAGCLPMFIQMPVFISLFSTIGEGFPLRHAPFVGWIKDLSAPDQFMTMAFDIPFLGNGDGTTNLNLLVLFYVITMLIQQSMMPKSTEPQQQQMQKTMKFVMIGFAFILYNYSSGLMLYFVGSNTLGMMESWYIRNKVLPSIEAKKKAKAKA